MEDLENEVKKVNKAIIETNPEWSFWQRTLANLINASGVFLWVFVSVYLLYTYDKNLELSILRDAMLNIIIPATVYGVFTLFSAMTLVSWFFPYFSFRTLMEKGTPMERLGCMGFWAVIGLCIAMIICKAINPG